jgi:hypothetical protein
VQVIINLGKDSIVEADIFNDKRYGHTVHRKQKPVGDLFNKNLSINHAFWLNKKGEISITGRQTPLILPREILVNVITLKI